MPDKVNTPRSAPTTFNEVWDHLRDLFGGGKDIYTLARGAKNHVRVNSSGAIEVSTNKGNDTLSRDWLEQAWQLIAAIGILSEESLPAPIKYRSSFIMAILSKLPYVDYSTYPRTTLFLTSHKFSNNDLSHVFGVASSGGIRISGTSTKPRHIVFTTETSQGKGSGNPYVDRWEGGVFYYTGEGLNGDQTLTRGNLALHSSHTNSCPIYGFEKQRPNEYTYIGRFRVVDMQKSRQPDEDGNERDVYVFPMRPAEEQVRKGESALLEVSKRPTNQRKEQDQHTQCLTVYLGKQMAGNFRHGLDHLTWGFPQERAAWRELGVGDFVLFGRGYTGGSPRTQSVVWQRHQLQEIVIARVTTSPYKDDTPLWPDEGSDTEAKSYPYRFGFEVLQSIEEPVALSEDGPLGSASEALRRSAASNSSNTVPADEVPIIQPFLNDQSKDTIDNTDEDDSELEDVILDQQPIRIPLSPIPSEWDWPAALAALIEHVKASGLVYEPWQIATYVTALRSKPFVILAGISGTGKSKLPRLIAQLCGQECELLPVRPDWTDSSDLLGYTNLSGQFLPGPLLKIARRAHYNPETTFVAVLDEMNLARVEHYFAEVLSLVESRTIEDGSWVMQPLVSIQPGEQANESPAAWTRVGLPPNLILVGTVNMDESTHGFSRKVLDRAFTMELSDVQLDRWGQSEEDVTPIDSWPAPVLIPQLTSLSQVTNPSARQREVVGEVVSVLEELNKELKAAQLQVGYRVRDEVALFVLNANDTPDAFVTSAGDPVDPMDIAISMKVLPRIIGGSGAVRRVVTGILGWAIDGSSLDEEKADQQLARWKAQGRPDAISEARYPRCAARACLLWERLVDDGFTSYWL